MSIRDRIKLINESVDDEVDFDRFAHPVDSDEDEVEIEDENKEVTADDVIKRAVTEEEDAINTYDEILGLLGENDGDITEMIKEIKKDEEDHLALLNHYVETGEVWTDEDLKAQEENGGEEETAMVEESDELLESDATPEFLEELKNLLNTYCRQSINSITLEKDEKLGEDIVNVDGKKINIEGDSNLAVIKDILHQIG